MSAKQSLEFRGKIYWASVPPNKARPPQVVDPKAPNNTDYSVGAPCDKERFEKLMKAGIPPGTKLRTDEKTGDTYITIRGTKVKRLRDKETGEEKDAVFNDPFVIDEDRNDFVEKIGNGTEGIVIAELAATPKGKVLRLKGVQVLKHVPFVSNNVDKYSNLLAGSSSKTSNKEETLDDFI